MTDQTITPLPDAPRTSGVRRAVRIDQEGGRAAVFIDDTDIARSVTAATVDIKAGHLPEITFTMLPGQFAFIGDTALLKVDDATRAALLALGWTESADSDTQWGYAFVDSPTSVCGPVSELTARRKVDGDYSAVLHRRDLVDGEPGDWKAVETR